MGANLSSTQPEMQNDKKPLPLGFSFENPKELTAF
jgi:hypothetical protein